MKHEDSHHHAHVIDRSQVNKAYIIGISLNFLFVLIEAGVGISVNSLSLLSDAGHNLADVVSLGLSLLAFRLLRVKPNKKYTYGYRKTSILVALFNTMFLLISIGAIVYEAVHRLISPYPTSGGTIAIVAGIGIVINSITAIMFMGNKEKDINIKSAYLHLLNDALISAGIVIGGIIIHYTGWYRIDSIFSILVAVIIIFGAWTVLRASIRLSLDGVPVDINIEDIRETALGIRGVKSIHHIHIWAISTTENALTAHLVLQPDATVDEELNIKNQMKRSLESKNISHVTLETEKGGGDCETLTC